MPTMTLAIPAELKKRMESHAIINWSAVARKAFEQQLRDLETLQRFAAKVKLTEAEALKFGREVNKRVSAHYRKKFKSSAVA